MGAGGALVVEGGEGVEGGFGEQVVGEEVGRKERVRRAGCDGEEGVQGGQEVREAAG